MTLTPKHLIIALYISSALAACAPVEQFCEQESAYTEIGAARIRKGSGSVYSKLQSNQRRMIYGSVIYENGQPVVTLSKEEALSIGISAELYDECVAAISNTRVL